MFRTAIPLGRWAGIAVRAHWSVLVVLLLITDLLASAALPRAAPGASPGWYWVTGLLTAAGFLASLLLHEFSHAAVARRHGVEVKRITLWMLGGAAELEDEPATPKADFRIAVAGPVTSALIGMVGLGAAVLLAEVVPPLPVSALAWLGVGNLALAMVNLLPGAPLDGGRMLRAAIWARRGDRARAGTVAGRVGQVLGAALGIAGLAQLLLSGRLAGLGLVLLGWFQIFAAQAEFAAGPLRERLGGVRVREIMNPSPTVAPGWWTVDAFAEHAAGAGHDRVFPVLSFDGVPVGVVSLGDLIRVSADARRATTVADVARKDQAVTVVGADAHVTELMKRVFLRHGRDLVLVTESSALAGVVGAGDLARAVELATLGHRPRASDLR
ncbi:site-2 protease family protein [Amycolatopsis oliviviridis]|uniref:Zinc metalloprotease n=1 Tax=Amycolatopsis oliviviridis TaxID=1471590 RepID=A0ABQ3MD48_9PSEU|nr:site-2 protease family protein [Amycolatopsis oliviviridis]GHH38804.1 putative zinc metalloprotease Rip3 [Amycolatopsis oliviviridis]